MLTPHAQDLQDDIGEGMLEPIGEENDADDGDSGAARGSRRVSTTSNSARTSASSQRGSGDNASRSTDARRDSAKARRLSTSEEDSMLARVRNLKLPGKVCGCVCWGACIGGGHAEGGWELFKGVEHLGLFFQMLHECVSVAF